MNEAVNSHGSGDAEDVPPNRINELTTRAGLTLGGVPRIVGVATSMKTVGWFVDQDAPPCDMLEMRLDRMLAESETGWLESVQAVEARGVPVIGTLRLAVEGGAWTDPDEDRWPLLAEALAVCSCVDVECRSPLLSRAVAVGQRHGTVLIASHHDFERTPEVKELQGVADRLKEFDGGVVLKIAAQVNGAQDVDMLRHFLTAYEGTHPLCLIGMGEAGVDTRVDFPRLGSCLTYGHLDKSTAPGQLSCQELKVKCRIQQ